MLTQEEDVEIHALKERGWSISEIARHTIVAAHLPTSAALRHLAARSAAVV